MNYVLEPMTALAGPEQDVVLIRDDGSRALIATFYGPGRRERAQNYCDWMNARLKSLTEKPPLAVPEWVQEY